MTQEHVVWAGAIRVEELYGDNGVSFIGDRIEALMDRDDIKGVELWARIGRAYDRLAQSVSSLH